MKAKAKATRTLRHDGTPEQRAFWTSPAKYRAFVGGIGSGKTRAGCVEILRQPPRSIGMVIAPTYPMLRDATRATFLQLARRGCILDNFNSSANIATLIDGKQVVFRSADNPDSLRGPNLDWFYQDEAAMSPEEAWLIMIGRLRGSGNVDKSNLRGWLTTTPRGRNWVWKLFAQSDSPDRVMIRATTRTNTYLPTNFIANVEASYSERWRAQELGGEFVDDSGGVFRNVSACATATPQAQALPGHQYVIGADWARTTDYTVFAVIDCTTRELVALDRFADVGYEMQVGRLLALAGRFNPDAIIAEENSMGGPLVERLQALDLPVRGFVTTNASKAMIVEALALAFETSGCKILNDPVIVGELEAYEQERLPGGMMRYGAPQGMHDDTVMALALAWHGATQNAQVFV